MTNSMWVSRHCPFFCHAISLQLIPWTNSQWVIILFFCHASHLITNRWWLPFFLPCTFIASHPITNSMWVTLSLFYAIQSHHILMTNRGWVTLLFLSANSYGQLQVLVSDTTIFLPSTSNDKQRVSDTTLIFCHALSWPTSACEWHCPCLLSSYLIPCPTACEWHSPFLHTFS